MTILEIDANSSTYTIEVTWFRPGKPAVTHKLPEDCTPADDAEIEFEVKEQQLQYGWDECDFDEDFDPGNDDDFISEAIKQYEQLMINDYESEH